MNRRDLLGNVYTAMTGIGWAHLLAGDGWAASQSSHVAGQTHHPAKAKRVLQIFCPGAASHMDLWEHKPSLEKYHGQPLPGGENLVSFQGKNGNLMKSPWDMPPAGETGKRISSMLPHMARHVDRIAFIHSMHSKTNTHGPGCVFMNTGHASEGSRVPGAWTSYALGSANDNLPTYVAMPDIRGEPPNGKANWSNGFLPAKHQGIALSAQQPIRNLDRPESISADSERASRELLSLLNERHAEAHPELTELRARMAAYELAARMQLSAPEVMELSVSPSRSTSYTRPTMPTRLRPPTPATVCSPDDRRTGRAIRQPVLCVPGFGCRRPVELGRSQDTQVGLRTPLPDLRSADRCSISDLAQPRPPDDTLVLWTTEFGRMPTHQEGTTGRDHNPDGFTCWMLGRVSKEASPTEPPTNSAAARAGPHNGLGLLRNGAPPLRLRPHETHVYHNGLDRRLTDVHGNVIEPILA
ncbi:MAG: DUF1501 domain-containing protein [Planctomycetaceae bacterium]